MFEPGKQSGLWLAVIISAVILAVLVVWMVTKPKPAEHNHTEHHHLNHDEHSSELSNAGADDIGQPRMSLDDVIRTARTWGPIYQSWYGKEATDFTLTDITGREHKLGDYRGKDVMIIFWASWCTPCKMEVPHLIALRNLIGEDELAMLAISYKSFIPSENAETVKKFVEQNNINYTVFSVGAGKLTEPFDAIRALPSSFFIDPEGKIKLATEGVLSLGAIKAILQAE